MENNQNGNGGINGEKWTRWMKENLIPGTFTQVPISALAFTRQQVLSKGVLTDADLGTGLILGDQEYFEAEEICRLECEAIGRMPSEQELPVITDQEIRGTHLLLMRLGMFTLPATMVASKQLGQQRMVVQRHVRNWTPAQLCSAQLYLVIEKVPLKEGLLMHRQDDVIVRALRRRSPLWIFGSEVPPRAAQIHLSAVHAMHPELGLDRPEVWKKHSSKRLLAVEELRAPLQDRLLSHLDPNRERNRGVPVFIAGQGPVFYT